MSRSIRLILLTIVIVPAMSARATGQEPDTVLPLTIPSIMRGPEVAGRPPERIRWSPDSRWIYFDWLEPGADWRETLKPFRVRAEPGSTPEQLSPAQMDSLGPLVAGGPLSPDRRWKAVEYGGDLYVVDLRTGEGRRLTATNAGEASPTWGRDSRQLFYILDRNLFATTRDAGAIRQLTDIRSGPAPDEKKVEGQRGALEDQQRELFEVIRDRWRDDSLQKAETARRDSLRPRTNYLRKGEEVTRMSVSPAGEALLFVAETPPGESRRVAQVPEYVTRSGYTETLTSREKVGDARGKPRLGFLRIPRGEIVWIPVIPGDTTTPPSDVRILGWNEDGSRALVYAVAGNYKSRYLHLVSADSGAIVTVDLLTDSAWVGGPCAACAGWYDDGRRFWYVSEKTGHAHLYSRSADGSDETALTEGDWEVLDVELTPDRLHFLLHTNEGSPFEQHAFLLPVEGGPRARLTSASGAHALTLSPDGRRAADLHSKANRPPELFVMPLRAGAAMSQLTTSPTREWLAREWIVPPIVWIPASDSIRVPARLYRPQDLGAEPNGAGVIFVHGAGYLHNVHNYWSTYYREHMFHHFLASQGYVVLDIDYRGSAGYGRDWRTAVYRHMGGRDLQDQVDGSRYLGREFGIPPERVGIYGGSYGGFITLMALFTEAEHFGAGAALRSVTDWAHYNHPYTARILNDPATDTLAYRQSSPIYFAEGLEDPLLILHGMVDVNVHFQDVVRLQQRLIELGKTNWELAAYPVEDHAFVRPSSWTDEYRRIFELFERTIGRKAVAP